MGTPAFRFATSVAFASLMGSLFLTGCTLANTAAREPQKLDLSGTVFGGTTPINGSHVYLYAAGTGGYAGPGIAASKSNTSVSLLNQASTLNEDSSGNWYVTASSTGGFSFAAGNPKCTSGQQLYAYATGGNAIGGDPTLPHGNGNSNGSNPSIGLLAVLGECSTVTSSTHFVINEMSTVAAGYALAGFATDATHISDDEKVSTNTTQGAAATGMANAFLNTGNLINLQTAAPLTTTPGGNSAVPTATLNTIASLFANCVESVGAGATCSGLFEFAGLPITGSSSNNLANVVFGMAHDPQGSGSPLSVAELYNTTPTNAAFMPTLSTAPNDFSIAITYGGGQIYSPGPIAVGPDGSVYVANVSGSAPNSFAELSGSNAAYTQTGILFSYPLAGNLGGIALDVSGDIWIEGNDYTYNVPVGNAQFHLFNAVTGTATGIAIDRSGNIWASFSTQTAIFSPSGSIDGYKSLNVAASETGAASIDANGFGWITDVSQNVVKKIGVSSSLTTTSYSLETAGTPFGTSFAPNGSLWIANTPSTSGPTGFPGELEYVNSNGFTTNTGGNSALDFTEAVTNSPYTLTMASNGLPWTNCYQKVKSDTQFGICYENPANSGEYGFLQGTALDGSGAAGMLIDPSNNNQLAFDASGNVWVSNGAKDVLEFVGAASPMLTPVMQGVLTNKVGMRP